jgi:hypothetical protein
MKTFITFLLEGGAAIKSSSRINQNNVEQTINNIFSDLLPKLNITDKDVKVLGSTGKKDPSKNGTPDGSSGDIDLAISIQAVVKSNGIDATSCFDFIVNAVKGYTEVKPMKSKNVISIAFPITNTDGNQEGKFVQLDLMPVDNLKYAEWAYYSPSYTESQYKRSFSK